MGFQATPVLAGDLRRAIRERQLELVYQPILELGSGEVSGFEALMRWRHPRRGLIAPAEFIPLAEKVGLIVPMGLWALRQALAVMSRLPADLRVSVNVSPIQLTGEHLLSELEPLIAAAALKPGRLELEITETALLGRDRRTLAHLMALRRLGLRLGMDDFGTGYSSLSSLMELPFDNIKIDRTFIAALGRCRGSAAVIRAVVELAAGLHMSTTAEGVETGEQVAVLRELGCTEGQGYWWSRPLSAEETVARYGIKAAAEAAASEPAEA